MTSGAEGPLYGIARLDCDRGRREEEAAVTDRDRKGGRARKRRAECQKQTYA
jgi:hypothetical protein